MRALDAAASDPIDVLVARAGEAVARAAITVLGGTYGRTVNVVCGPGNNGADGRVAAERLRGRGVRVRVFDALACPPELPPSDLVIDAAFGTGFRGTWRPPEPHGAPVLAVDVPSGLDGLTGAAPEHVWSAVATVTFAALKPGLVLGRGPDLAGSITVADIGIDIGIDTGIDTGIDAPGDSIGLVEQPDVASWVPVRSRTSHKWSHAVRVVAGSDGMTGAAALAASAAQRAGAGMVLLSSPGVDTRSGVEVVRRSVPAIGWADDVLRDLGRFHALVVGPGLGRADHTLLAVQRLVMESNVPAVVDGDGLLAMAWNEGGTAAVLRDREAPTVLTPHDGEYSMLTGHAPSADRISAAHELAELSGAVVLLKGPTSVVAAPTGETLLVAIGDERLATAGTGDVLSGLIGALLARSVPAFQAAAAAAWIHGAAGSLAPRFGAVASDLIIEIPAVLAELATGNS
ncbi:MAG TPA: NAD(P)H-hydrate dehydratase [Ilumatobacter sp.]|nr:NAD(P)H-hydrate dehydratase [Ilumatobacter sp.]